MELEANPDFYAGEPAIERVIVRFLGSIEAGYTELLAGGVDEAHSLNLAARGRLSSDPRFSSYIRYRGATAVLFLNHHLPLLADPRIRKALVLALDRRSLANAIGLPRDLPIVDGLFTFSQLRQGEFPTAYDYDPEHARRLLDEAGWTDWDGDGVRERDGVSAHFEIRAPAWWERSAILVSAQLAAVGIQTDLLVTDDQVNLHRYRSGDFDALVGYVTPYNLVLLSSRETVTGYDNEEYKSLVRQARTTPDPHVQDSLIRESWPHLFEDVPVVFLHPMVAQIYVHRRVRGLSSPWRADPARYMDELWIEERP
jgi:peptide/nickel transport system substrate-binding protein